jgi:hypothetical protein
MFALLSVIVALMVFILQFWFPYVGMIYLLMMLTFAYATIWYLSGRGRELKTKEELGLSDEGYEMLKKYRHIFDMPFASREYGSICAIHQFVVVLLAALSVYQGMYWMILMAILGWFAFAYASFRFNPVQWFEKSGQIHAYDEVKSMMSNR